MKAKFFFIIVLVIPFFAKSQDTNDIWVLIDTSNIVTDFSKFEVYQSISLNGRSVNNLLTRTRNKEDFMFATQNNKLLSQEPSSESYEEFYKLGVAFYELDSLAKAQFVFSKIVESDSLFYTNSRYFSSDIPGDTTTNSYGYGSFTFNYKNKSCLFLSRIHLIQEEYDSAQKYLDLARNRYIATYNCGTGYNMYRGKLNGLQTLCYQGKKEYKKLIKLNIPYYNDNSDVLINAIREVFTEAQVIDSLTSAIESMKFKLNLTYTTVSTFQNYGEENEKEIEYQYHDGQAVIQLFGEKVVIKYWLNLKENEVATALMYLDGFKNSYFYKELVGAEG